jgi:hypothetical protein|tara:strand:+ start:2255 stop:2506 length:252 start_codon:yes stop_codon:yes gene_type:complete
VKIAKNVGLSVTVKRNASANLNANVSLSAAKRNSPLNDLLKVVFPIVARLMVVLLQVDMVDRQLEGHIITDLDKNLAIWNTKS